MFIRPASTEHKTAVHEAGHAIAAAFSPQIASVDSVSILPDLSADGRISYRLYPSESETLIISVAGMIAEELVFGKHGTHECLDDLEAAKKAARKLIEDACEEAAERIRNNKKAFNLLTSELLRIKHIDSSTFYKILDEAKNDPS